MKNAYSSICAKKEINHVDRPVSFYEKGSRVRLTAKGGLSP